MALPANQLSRIPPPEEVLLVTAGECTVTVDGQPEIGATK
jgi:hypothetical protein